MGQRLRMKTLPGLCQLLKRVKICWKRARQHVHSPDVYYVEKLCSIRINLLALGYGMEFVFQDEFTFYRQPSLANAYAVAGKTQPLAELGWKGNYFWRIAATLSVFTGSVVFDMARQFDLARLTKFYQKVVRTFPNASVICMAQDNWPVHFHPNIMGALIPQKPKWPLHVPGNWPTTPDSKVKHLELPIQLFPLPTYASWCNPIEKLWKLLRQEVLHLHSYADDWDALKLAVENFLAEFSTGSKELLKYVGLADPTRIYHSIFNAPAGSSMLRY